MALLRQRAAPARATVCELAQVENMICHIGDLTMDAAMNDRVPPRWGNRSPDFAPQGCYRCAGDDQWVVMSVRSDAEWPRLRAVLGSPAELDGAALDSWPDGTPHHDEIDAVIARWTAGRDRATVTEMLQAVGIPAGPVLDEADALSDPQLHHRGFFHLLDPSVVRHPSPPRCELLDGRTPPVIWRAAPTLGQDNEYVYKDVIGVSDEDYDELVAEGHAGTAYV